MKRYALILIWLTFIILLAMNKINEEEYPPPDWHVSGCGCELIQKGPYWTLQVWAHRINPDELWRKTIRMRDDETKIRKDCMEWLKEMEKRRKNVREHKNGKG